MTGWSEHAIWWHVYPLGFLDGRPLDTLTDSLDHLVDLGANGLALGPIFTAETHGYDTVDHYTIDPRLGTEDHLRRLVDAAGQRGVRILLDGVFNHVGRTFPRFVDAAAGGAAADWFVPEGSDWRVFEGHHRLVTLNHANPAVAGYVTDVMNHWLDRGIAGWRLDAAYAVAPAFWAHIGAAVKARHPHAWLVGEVIHGDYTAYADGLDSVTQYELWKAVWSSLNDRNLFELAHTLGRHNTLLDTLVPMTFLGNHDVTRIASKIADRRLLAHALVVLCTVGGIPSVYYGDELGLTGVKEDREGGDDAIRPPFPPGQQDRSVYRLHQELIGLRRRHPWLVRARTTVTTLTNTTVCYVSAADGQRLAVVLNLTDAPADIPLPDGAWDLLAGSLNTPFGWAVLAVR